MLLHTRVSSLLSLSVYLYVSDRCIAAASPLLSSPFPPHPLPPPLYPIFIYSRGSGDSSPKSITKSRERERDAYRLIIFGCASSFFKLMLTAAAAAAVLLLTLQFTSKCRPQSNEPYHHHHGATFDS